MKHKKLILAIILISSHLCLKAQIAKIPFEFRGSHLFIKVKINQTDSLRFIFDSGATGASIDSTAAQRIGIDKNNRQTTSIAGSGGVQSYTMAVHQNLMVGAAEVKDINLVLVNFASLSSTVGSRIDGIIGYEVLDKYIAQLDFDHKTLLLYDHLKAVDTTGYAGIPFEFNKGVLIPRFPISITLANGETFTGRVMFDTGNAFSLIVSTPFSKYHDFNSKLGEITLTQGRGMNAITQDQVATIKSMAFNGFKFGTMDIRLTVNEKAEPKDGYLGILGIEVIKRFNIILDYADKKIYLKPNQNYSDSFAPDVAKGIIDKESIAFLEKNKKKAGVNVTSSGLQYKIIQQGTGPKPTMEERVTLNFTVRSINGQKLWSTYDKNIPWVHRLDKAIDGVREAALMMPPGSKWILYIPAKLAYGDSGFDEVLPGMAVIYELEVLPNK